MDGVPLTQEGVCQVLLKMCGIFSKIRFHCQGIPNNRVSWSATQYHHRRHIQKAWQPEEAAGVVIL